MSDRKYPKEEAKMRLAMRTALASFRAGKSPEEGLQAIKDHLALMKALNRPHTAIFDEDVEDLHLKLR